MNNGSQKRLYRSRTDRLIAGVAGGLGEYLHVDSTLVRIVILLLALMSFGTVVILYILLAIIIPLTPVAPSTPDVTA